MVAIRPGWPASEGGANAERAPYRRVLWAGRVPGGTPGGVSAGGSSYHRSNSDAHRVADGYYYPAAYDNAYAYPRPGLANRI